MPNESQDPSKTNTRIVVGSEILYCANKACSRRRVARKARNREIAFERSGTSLHLPRGIRNLEQGQTFLYLLMLCIMHFRSPHTTNKMLKNNLTQLRLTMMHLENIVMG
jgi:hypothetical protein